MAEHTHPWDEGWIFGKRLGKGGQGFAHLVTRRKAPSEQAALKFLKNNQSTQARGRMHREVASLQVLSSAGGAVPSVLAHNTEDYLDTSVELYVVMDYIPGHTIREIVDEQGVLDLNTAIQITLCICNTIETAHTFPILHRDLKPENIIARDLDAIDVVIVDYGLSFNAEDPDVTVTDETFRNRFLDLPETNTPGGNRRDPRSDVTAACAIFYYLLTGHVPGQLQDGDGRLPHLRPGFSLHEALGQTPYVGLLDILFNCGFAPNINNRFQTVAEFRDRISLLTNNATSADTEDPVAVAERASDILRQRDRTTQIREFQKPASKLFQLLQQFVSEFVSKLGRFRLSIDSENHLGKDLPAGLDRVSPAQLKFQLNPAHHDHLRIVVYAIGSRGEQCVVLRQTYGREGRQNKIYRMSDYEEILWYDATGDPDIEPIQLDLKSWLNVAIQELTDIVLSE